MVKILLLLSIAWSLSTILSAAEDFNKLNQAQAESDIEGDEECDGCDTASEKEYNSPSKKPVQEQNNAVEMTDDKIENNNRSFSKNAILGFVAAAKEKCVDFKPNKSQLWSFVEGESARSDLNEAEIEYFTNDFRERLLNIEPSEICSTVFEMAIILEKTDFNSLRLERTISAFPVIDRGEYLAIGMLLRAENICPNVEFVGTKSWRRYVARRIDIEKNQEIIRLGSEAFDRSIIERGSNHACDLASETILMDSK